MIRSVSQNYLSSNISYQQYKTNQVPYRGNKLSKVLDEDFAGTDDLKVLKRRYNSALLLLSTLCLSLSFIALTGKGFNLKIFKNSKTSAFQSLKDDAAIPTLETCKSIDKNLKNLLENEVNHQRADAQLLRDTGNPESSNRFLLSGAPGNGKSFFAKIFAKTIDADYKEVMQSDFNSVWAGEGTANFKNIFEDILKTAKKNKDKKYVVCFNELDTIVQPVETLSNAKGTHGTTLLQHRSVFLNYLDKISKETPNVIIIGTTNIGPKNNRLDGASLSRFKKIIEVPFPDKKCIYEALKEKIKDVKYSEDFINNNENDILKLAEEMEKREFSYRNLDTVIDEAKNLYLTDAIKNKNQNFKFDYLKQAKDNLFATDGELRTVKKQN